MAAAGGQPGAARRWSRRGAVLAALLAGPVLGYAAEPSPAQAVARLARIDPASPATLQGRLEYAGRLALASGGDCAGRLAEAQSQLDAAAGSPALAIVLPLGPARLANIEYQVHLARASCGTDAARRASELRLALAAAQRSVELYRDALDYPSMATLQFNVGATEHLLGDPRAAVAALKTAIQMDREYGLREDEQDNLAVLADWTGQQLSRAGASGPPRSITLKFGWRASDAQVRIDVSSSSLSNGRVTHTSATTTVQRHVRASHGGWLISHELGQIATGPATGLTDAGLLGNVAIPFSQALLELPDIEVSAGGELKEVVSDEHFATRLYDQAAYMISYYSPTHRKLSSPEIMRLAALFSPQVIEAQVEEDYGFETAAWIGATLERGLWYRTTAVLYLPGAIDFPVAQDVEMAYTHDVPCVAGVPQRACVEIVAHATPQQDAGVPDAGDVHWSATYVRLVTDPGSLTPYRLERRTYWYISQGRDRESGSQTVVATFTYRSGSS